MNRFLVLVIVSVAMGSLLSGALAAGQRREGQAQPFSPAVSFLNIARAAGVDFVHVNGASPEKYLVETMGRAGCFSTSTMTAGLTSSWSTGARSPIQQWQATRDTGSIATSATAVSKM